VTESDKATVAGSKQRLLFSRGREAKAFIGSLATIEMFIPDFVVLLIFCVLNTEDA
jgi:hypothetical protein